MPQTKQAHKALRQDAKKAHRNKIVKSTIRTLVKNSRREVEAGAATAEETIKTTIKALDKAVKHGQVKKNTGSRIKSRLMRAFNKKKTEKKS